MDPIGFVGDDSNLYAYSYADPSGYVDPDGEIANIAGGAALGVALDLGARPGFYPVFADGWVGSQSPRARESLRSPACGWLIARRPPTPHRAIAIDTGPPEGHALLDRSV